LVSEEVDRVISFAASKGKKRFAALIPATPYGQMIEPAFRKAVKQAGGEIVALQNYVPGTSSVLDSAKQIFAAIKGAGDSGQPVDALFVPAGQDEIAQLGPLISYSGLDTQKIKLIGTSAWDVPVISRDDRLIGGWYAATDPASWAAFSEKFQKTFGQAPPRLATLAYDAVSMAITLSRNPGPARFAAENLTKPSGFTGIDGAIRLKLDGTSARGLAVLEIEKYRSVVIDPALAFEVPAERVSSVSEASVPR
jgi:ABC-type branched-subunit amino acid transport system substrate-binding protein